MGCGAVQAAVTHQAGVAQDPHHGPHGNRNEAGLWLPTSPPTGYWMIPSHICDATSEVQALEIPKCDIQRTQSRPLQRGSCQNPIPAPPRVCAPLGCVAPLPGPGGHHSGAADAGPAAPGVLLQPPEHRLHRALPTGRLPRARRPGRAAHRCAPDLARYVHCTGRNDGQCPIRMWNPVRSATICNHRPERWAWGARGSAEQR